METSYLTPSLTNDMSFKLKEAGCTLTPFDAAVATYLLPESQLQLFLDVMDKRLSSQLTTGYDGILGMELADRDPEEAPDIQAHRPYTVHNLEYSTAPYEPIMSIMEKELAPILDVDIDFGYFMNESRHVAHNPERFSILYNAFGCSFHAPPGAQKNLPETSWGASLKTIHNRLYVPKAILANYFPITADDGETILAVLSSDKKALHLLVDLLRLTTNQAMVSHNATLFKHIIAQAVRIIYDKNNTIDRQQFFNTEWCEQDSMIRNLMPGKQNEIAQLSENTEALKKRIQEYQKEMVQIIRQHASMLERLTYLKANNLDDKAILLKQVEQIRRMPKIRGLDLAGNRNGNLCLCLLTDTLYCTDPRDDIEREIGRFYILVDFYHCEIRWFNMDRRITTPGGEKMHAPHIFSDGVACLGNWSEMLPSIIAKGDLPTIATMVVGFIEDVNVADSAGQYINRWPEASRSEESDNGDTGSTDTGSTDTGSTDTGSRVETMAA